MDPNLPSPAYHPPSRGMLPHSRVAYSPTKNYCWVRKRLAKFVEIALKIRERVLYTHFGQQRVCQMQNTMLSLVLWTLYLQHKFPSCQEIIISNLRIRLTAISACFVGHVNEPLETLLFEPSDKCWTPYCRWWTCLRLARWCGLQASSVNCSFCQPENQNPLL